MERIRQTTAGTYALTITTVDDDGGPVTITDPQVKVYSGAGVQVGTTDAPTPVAGGLTYTVPPGVMTLLDIYLVVWSGTAGGNAVEYRQWVELVGGFLFEVPEIRDFDKTFADANLFPAARIRKARTAAEARLEAACHYAFVPRGGRASAYGRGLARLTVDALKVRSLKAATIGTEALTAEQLATIVVREWGAFDRPAVTPWPLGERVTFHYEHGQDFPSLEVTQAAMLLACEYLAKKQLSSRATVESFDGGFFRLSVAGAERPTGIPEVDAVITSVGRRRPLVG